MLKLLRKHVFADILAYVCTSGDCPSDRCFFETREEMTAHLGKQHGLERSWASQKCPLCLEETGDGRNAISLHFSRHMEEIALGALPRSTESDTGSETSSSREDVAGYVSASEDSDPTAHQPHDAFLPSTMASSMLPNPPGPPQRPSGSSMAPPTISTPYMNIYSCTPNISNDNLPTLKEGALEAGEEKITGLLNSFDNDLTHETPSNTTTPAKYTCTDCEKQFKRPDDLIKHKRAHSRMWKCPQATCKYHDYGWLTEKELNRHVNDKHTNAPPQYKCLFAPCPYVSKRVLNCKQHMEKAHGWDNERY